jgi:hypothetical protein
LVVSFIEDNEFYSNKLENQETIGGRPRLLIQ